jgi:hypothetical protein
VAKDGLVDGIAGTLSQAGSCRDEHPDLRSPQPLLRAFEPL